MLHYIMYISICKNLYILNLLITKLHIEKLRNIKNSHLNLNTSHTKISNNNLLLLPLHDYFKTFPTSLPNTRQPQNSNFLKQRQLTTASLPGTLTHDAFVISRFWKEARKPIRNLCSPSVRVALAREVNARVYHGEKGKATAAAQSSLN